MPKGGKNTSEAHSLRLHTLARFTLFIYLKSYGTALSEAPPTAARVTFPIVATKLESTAQCNTVPVLPITGPLKMSKLWLIRGAAQNLGKIKKKTVGEKKEGP